MLVYTHRRGALFRILLIQLFPSRDGYVQRRQLEQQHYVLNPLTGLTLHPRIPFVHGRNTRIVPFVFALSSTSA